MCLDAEIANEPLCKAVAPAAPIADPVTPEPVTPEPVVLTWPEGWELEFCYALDQLGDANGHIIAASDAGVAFDFDGAIEEAEQAATDAGEAVDALEIADAWKPAHSTVVYLSSSGSELEKAANLMVLGMQAFDASIIEEAVVHQEKASYQLSRATTSLEALTGKYGAIC